MSDNEDILGEDLGDHSLADYNLGNEEEEQLLADDYEPGSSQNVPVSVEYGEHSAIVTPEYQPQNVDYVQPVEYAPVTETECVVPNIKVEVPNVPSEPNVPSVSSVPHVPPPHSTYAPYEPRHYENEHAVPPPIPAGPAEPPQIVPSEVTVTVPNGDGRERFMSERPIGAPRMPQVRNIPDTLDKVVVYRGGYSNRSRTTWRNPQFNARYSHPYRRNNVYRASFAPRSSYTLPQITRHFAPQIRSETPEIRPEVAPKPIRPEVAPKTTRPDLPPQIQTEIRPPIIRPEIRPQIIPEIRPEVLTAAVRPQIPRPEVPRPEIPRPELIRPDVPPLMGPVRQERPFQNFPRYERLVFPPRFPYTRPYGPRNVMPSGSVEPEPPVPVPTNLPVPPSAMPRGKVLINPHFKGNFQPPPEVPLYIPTRIQKSPPRPISPTIENKFGPVKDIDDAAERFIAEQRDALARAASRKFTQRRSPQRYIENTTIEIENDLARRASPDDDLLRRQEEFINANRAGLRRRMRTPSPPPRRSPSPPRRSPERRHREKHREEEDNEYRRRVREQEALREHVLRAKEVRRRRNAAQGRDREREIREKEPLLSQPNSPLQKDDPQDKDMPKNKETKEEQTKPDATKTSPDRSLTPDRPPLIKKDENKANTDDVNSSDGLTPPRAGVSDDELELILGDIDGILSDDDDTGRFKDTPRKEQPSKPVSDLRSKLPAKSNKNTADSKSKTQRQKIVFTKHENKKDNKANKEKESPPAKKRPAAPTADKADDSKQTDVKKQKTNPKPEEKSSNKPRQRIIFDSKEEKQEKEKPEKFATRRVILQRKSNDKSVFSRIDITNDPSKPNPGIFTRAVRTIADTKAPDKTNEPQVEYDDSDEDVAGNVASNDASNVASVTNLPHGMTDTRLKTLAGNDVQSLQLNKEDRTAKIVFKTTNGAETFRKKFNNKMVAASRLSVTLK